MKRMTGRALKRLEDGCFGGYLVSFTDDSDRDLHGEYFTADTDFMLGSFRVAGSPVLYNHALDEAIKAVPIGSIESIELRDDGIYAIGRNEFAKQYEAYVKTLKRPSEWKLEQMQYAEEYQKMLDEMIDDGMLGWSSGALPQAVEVEKSGWIKTWPIIEGTLTPTPAEPDNTRVRALRSKFAALFREHTGAKETGGKDVDASDTEAPLPIKQTNEDMTIMDREELREMVASLVAEILEDMQEEKAMDGADEEEAARAAMEEEAQRMMDEDEKMSEAYDDEKMTDDERKSLARSVINRQVVKLIQTGLTAANKHREEERKARREATRKALADSESVRNPKHEAGAPAKSAGRVEPGDDQRYAHLDDFQMAFIAKSAASSLQPHPGMRRRMKLRDMVEAGVLSEGFVKTLAHRTQVAYKNWQPKRDRMGLEDAAAIKAVLPRAIKADELQATDITNQGLEWVEFWYDTQLWDRARDRTELFNLMSQKGMRVVTIPQGHKGMNVKLETGSGTVYTLNEANNTAADGRPEVTVGLSQFTTSEVEQPVKYHILAHGVTFQLEEQSMIDVLQWVPEEMTTTLAEALESAIINGDTRTGANTNINLIDSTPGTGLETPLYIAWDGIRKNFLVTNTAFRIDKGNTALAMTDYQDILDLFPSSIKNRKNEMLFIMDSSTESATRKLSELLTWGIAGNNNTIYSGDLPPLFGVQPYMSGQLGLSNGNGAISATAGNNTQGTIAAVYAPYWQYGRFRNTVIETQRYPLSQTTVLVASIGHAFTARGEGAAAGAYDIQV